MKIDLDRLQKLAGITSKKKPLNETSNRSFHDDPSVSDEADFRFGSNQLAEGDIDEEAEDMDEMVEADEDMDEMVEVDEKMLVREIRRARKMMAESLNKSKRSKRKNVQETKLRKIVSEELDSVLKDLNLSSGWVYGKRKPRNSRPGVVNTTFPGIGFKNK
jgi:hypothetical protein